MRLFRSANNFAVETWMILLHFARFGCGRFGPRRCLRSVESRTPAAKPLRISPRAEAVNRAGV